MDENTARGLLQFAEVACHRFRGEAAKAAQEELEKGYADLASAMEWFAAHHSTDESLQLASSLVPFWMATKRLDDGLLCLDRALALPNGDDNDRGRALFDAGYLAFWMGDYDTSSSLQHDALQLGRLIGNPTVTALALVGLARIALKANVSEARRLCREALAATEGTDDQEGRSSALHVLAVAAQMAGDLQEASDLMRQRIDLGRTTGNLATIAIESNNLSMVERQLGNLEEAEALARSALDISSRRGDSLAIAWNLNGLAACAALLGHPQRGAMLVGAADAAMESAGGAWPPDELVHHNRTVSILKEGLGLPIFEEHRAAGRAMTNVEAIGFALSSPHPPTSWPAA
jgi:tetratricopeptide (TPR) repeat protein